MRDIGVFDIQVGTAITIAIADGSRAGEEAEVNYLDAWAEALYARPAKLEWLAGGMDTGRLPGTVPVRRSGLENFRPEGFAGTGWPSLRECFGFTKSGMKSGNDSTFVAVTRDDLLSKVQARLDATGQAGYDASHVRELAYRPLDNRLLYNDLPLLNRPGPEMQRVWRAENVGLYSLPSGVGAGPAVWCHGLLPDYHAFRGSYGGYAFPLHDRRPTHAGPNVSERLIHGLTALYGTAVTAEDVFDAILCLLSADSYTLRFAEDLEDEFPHVPFPADHAVFARAVGLGAQIREMETFVRAPDATSDFVQLATPPTAGAVLDAGDPDETNLILCADGSGEVTALPEHLWDFEVSGYPVLRRWLEGRKGRIVDLTLFEDLRDICGRIYDLVDLFDQADIILTDSLDNPLMRGVIWPEAARGEANHD